MSILRIGVVVSALTLSACGGGGHATCKDQASTSAYAGQWGRDLSAAVESGKVTRPVADKAAKAVVDESKTMTKGDFGAFCSRLDELRKEAGF